MRLPGYDYSYEGCYFLTICTRNKEEILGRVARCVDGGASFVELTDTGEMVKRHVENMDDADGGVRLEHYVVMPNHVHLLILLSDGTPKAASPTGATIPRIVNSLKGLTSKKFGCSMWQRGYYDRIVRGEGEYRRIWDYIDTNPQRWEEDDYFG